VLNKAAEEISGYLREEVVGHNKIWEWNYPHEEYRKELIAHTKAISPRMARFGRDSKRLYDAKTEVIRSSCGMSGDC